MAPDRRDASAIRVGDELPAVVRFPTPEQLVRYAGAARDFSAIHYDADYARRRGFSGVIVHGLLKAAFLADLATDWAGPGAWLRHFGARYRGVDLPGEPLTCRGSVTAVAVVNGQCQVQLELWTESATGEVTTTGNAVAVIERATPNPTPRSNHEF